MNENRDVKKIILLIFGTFICLLAVNFEIERIIKQPYENNINFHKQIFNSSANLLFLTSGVIWICGSVWKFYKNYQCSQDQDEQNIFKQNSSFDEQQLEKIYVSKIKVQVQQQKKQINTLQSQQISIQSLPFLQIIKIVIPKYFQILCFFYATTFLSFPQVLIFTILSKRGLISLYEGIFNDENNKYVKFICSLFIFFGFGLFIYSYVDDSKMQNDQNLYRKQMIYGYMFVIGMCYLGVMKNILANQVNEKYGKLSALDSILLQSKTNCILSYLLSVYLNEQIYGSVFAVLHADFVWNVLGFSFVLFAGLLMKQHIKKYYSQFQDLIIILQKNLSLVLSLIYFGHGINQTLIFSICMIVSMTLVQFLLEFISSRQNDETPQISNEDGQSILKDQKQLYSQNENIHDNNEKRQLNA